MMILPFKLSNVNINHINMINIMNSKATASKGVCQYGDFCEFG